MPELPEVERGRLVAETVLLHTCQSTAKTTRSSFATRAELASRECSRTSSSLGSPTRQTDLAGVRERTCASHPFRNDWLASSVPGGQNLRFSRLELRLSGGMHLAMPDPRRFGRIRMRDDPCNEPPIRCSGSTLFTRCPTNHPFETWWSPDERPSRAYSESEILRRNRKLDRG